MPGKSRKPEFRIKVKTKIFLLPPSSFVAVVGSGIREPGSRINKNQYPG
jgi:hypothetical protein